MKTIDYKSVEAFIHDCFDGENSYAYAGSDFAPDVAFDYLIELVEAEGVENVSSLTSLDKVMQNCVPCSVSFDYETGEVSVCATHEFHPTKLGVIDKSDLELTSLDVIDRRFWEDIAPKIADVLSDHGYRILAFGEKSISEFLACPPNVW